MNRGDRVESTSLWHSLVYVTHSCCHKLEVMSEFHRAARLLDKTSPNELRLWWSGPLESLEFHQGLSWIVPLRCWTWRICFGDIHRYLFICKMMWKLWHIDPLLAFHWRMLIFPEHSQRNGHPLWCSVLPFASCLECYFSSPCDVQITVLVLVCFDYWKFLPHVCCLMWFHVRRSMFFILFFCDCICVVVVSILMIYT